MTEQSQLVILVRYRIKEGKREEFLARFLEEKILVSSQNEKGNLKYECSLPIDSGCDLCLTELWENEQAQLAHGQTAHYAKLTALKQEYVEDVSIQKYFIENN